MQFKMQQQVQKKTEESQHQQQRAAPQPVATRPSPTAAGGESHLDVTRSHQQVFHEEHREYELISAEFKAFCQHAGYNPPPPLPTDAARLFDEFASISARGQVTTVRTNALQTFRSEFAKPLEVVERKLEAMRTKLSRSQMWGSRVRTPLLKEVQISMTLPAMTIEMRPQIERAARFLAERWSPELGQGAQGVLSVYQDHRNGTTIVQLGIGGIGSVFLTLPQVLDPLEVARQVLRAMQGVFETALSDADPIAVVNGAFHQLNMKELLPNNVILRSRSGDTTVMRERISTLYERKPLSTANTRIVSALPISQTHMPAISLPAEDWDLWQRVHQQWATSVSNQGFAMAPSATAPSFLEALQTEQNVIVLVAHAETNSLRFPEPLPEGSQVRPEDIRRLSDRIRQNRPVVYLFCCETAKYDGIESIAQTLLDAGVAAVVAPQGILAADRQTRRLFEEFLDYGSHEIPVNALRDAERKTGQREMETWLG